jgi:hypothetical protein
VRLTRVSSIQAITLWQPWASLIARGLKRYETRSWAPPASLIGKRLAIHAGTHRTARGVPLWLKSGCYKLWPDLPLRQELPADMARLCEMGGRR